MSRFIKTRARPMLLLWGLALALTGCVVGTGVTPSGTAAVGLSYSNQTTIAIDLFVNSQKLQTMSPATDGSVAVTSLPPLPWTVEARTSGGRVLATMTVRDGDVTQGSGWMQGDAIRVDLSCGRLDLWAGPPILGPMPGSGSPGDCEP